MNLDTTADTISFDCYGTLVDWETGISRAFVEAAAADGLELDGSDVLAAYQEIEADVEAGDYLPYREVLAETSSRIAGLLGWSLQPDRAYFLAESLPDWPVFPDTRGALERLKSRFKVAILSNVDDDLLRATVERIGVEFDWIVTAQKTRSYKPALGHFEEAIRKIDGDMTRLLHAARSYFHDVVPCLQLGLSVVWVNRQGKDLPDAGARPLHTVSDLTELAGWLDV
ncbi:MAG: HAD family hydrolase [Gemmatimonadota bacterium]